MKKILKTFNVKEAQNGAKVVTRNGRNVKIIEYNYHSDDNRTIVATIEREDYDDVILYSPDGKFLKNGESDFDLFIEEEDMFKDGDILASHNYDDLWIIIFKKIDELKDTNNLIYYAMLNPINEIILESNCLKGDWELATEEEQQKLFNALKEKGLYWCPQAKCIKEIKFKQGQPVLVRSSDCAYYIPAIYIDYNPDADTYITTGGTSSECIEFDINKM